MLLYVLLAMILPTSLGSNIGTFTTKCTTKPCPGVTWKVDSSATKAAFTLFGPKDKWTSMTFTDTPFMISGKIVFDCIGGATSSVVIQTSTNIAGYINHPTPSNDHILLGPTSSTINGTLSCQFETAVSSDPKYIIIASGIVEAHSVKHKHDEKFISSSKVVPNNPLNITSDPGGERCKGCKQVHGTFMILAWTLFAGAGIVTARFYKPFLGNHKGTARWFLVHRLFMILAFLLTVAAFVLIFVAANGYSSFQNELAEAHPVIGIAVTFLCILNPIMAVFRCSPSDERRKIFNRAHWTVGFLAHTAGVVCIVIAFVSPTLKEVVGSADWSEDVVYAYVGVHYGFFIVLELLHWFSSPDPKSIEQPRLRLCLLVIYTLCVTGLSLALVVGVWNPWGQDNSASGSA